MTFHDLIVGGKKDKTAQFQSSGDSALFCCHPVERLPFTSAILVVPWCTDMADDLQLGGSQRVNRFTSRWLQQRFPACCMKSYTHFPMGDVSVISQSIRGLFLLSFEPVGR